MSMKELIVESRLYPVDQELKRTTDLVREVQALCRESTGNTPLPAIKAREWLLRKVTKERERAIRKRERVLAKLRKEGFLAPGEPVPETGKFS
ncbi:MAG: hypothetical protein ABIJ95_07905 [Pseudomonadota bacterium]